MATRGRPSTQANVVRAFVILLHIKSFTPTTASSSSGSGRHPTPNPAQAPTPRNHSTPTPTRSLALPGLAAWAAARCRPTLWLTGLTLQPGSGFLEESEDTYYQHLLVALMSARRTAPSLVPVVVFPGEEATVTTAGGAGDTYGSKGGGSAGPAVSGERLAQLRALGATVLFHTPTFWPVLQALAAEGRVGHNGARALGTFLRLDVTDILPKVLTELGPQEVARRGLQTEYVLWTDPDVIFYRDIDSCTIPSPPVWSIGADQEHEIPGSAGIIYFNMSAYGALWPALYKRGVVEGFGAKSGMLDQAFLLKHLGPIVTLLPDIFNYKPYWGRYQHVLPHYRHEAPITIMHVQGPKLRRALCVFDHMRAASKRDPSTPKGRAAAAAASVPAIRAAMAACGSPDPGRYAWLVHSLRHAWAQDGGALYREVGALFDAYLQGAMAA